MSKMKRFEESDVLKIQSTNSQAELKTLLEAKGITTNTLSSLVIDMYQFATISDFDVTQKLKLINLPLALMEELIASKTKEVFNNSLNKIVMQLAQRDQYFKQYFSQTQIAAILSFLKDNILDYYQLYEIVMDESPHFKFTTEVLQLVKIQEQGSLQQGTSIEPENIAVLKQVIGIRAPKQQKKDAKKK